LLPAHHHGYVGDGKYRGGTDSRLKIEGSVISLVSFLPEKESLVFIGNKQWRNGIGHFAEPRRPVSC
jgi:hypothetical protein